MLAISRPLGAAASVLESLAVVASAACLVALTVYVGYNLEPTDQRRLWGALRAIQAFYCINIAYNLFFRFKHTLRQSRIIKWIVDTLVLISLLAWIYPNPHHPWIPWLKAILYSKKFLFFTLGAYSTVTLCYALSRIPNRRTNPSLIMGGSFLLFIILGSMVLMLPRCTLHGISYFDSLFVASSAVCITGLSPVDIPTTFTPFGILVLSVLVQLGSLGVITFTSFFAMFFTGGTSIYNQLLLRDIIYSKSMNSLVPTLLYVLGFTASVEIIGAVAVYLTIPAELEMDTTQRLIFAGFHSMSSFCNAGFSILPDGMANNALMNSNQWIYIVTSCLIFAGAIGFPILVNFKEILRQWIIKGWARLRRKRPPLMPLHIFDLNTKIVLWTTCIILAVSSVAFFILESGNTLKGMGFWQKAVQSVFNSLIPRSAGFASVNPAHFLDVTLLLVMVQMVIGGSSQSMAGGIKVNTLGAVLLNLKSVLAGHEGTTAFNRTISFHSMRRAHAVVCLAAISLVAYATLELCLEPRLEAKAVMFEVVSALFTVGSSLGITAELCDTSKVVLCTAMFFGRVGLISLLCGFMAKPRDLSAHFPTDNIIIN